MKKMTLFVTLLVAIGLIFVGCGKKPADKNATDKKNADKKAKPAAEKKEHAATKPGEKAPAAEIEVTEPAEEPAEEPEAKKPAAAVHPWASLKVGDMIEKRTSMKMPNMSMITGMRQTVVSNDGKEVTYKMEMLDKDGKVTYSSDVKVSLEVKDNGKAAADQWKKTGTEKITVPAGEYECEVWEGPNDGKQWRSSDIPFDGMAKMYMKTGTTETTIELVKVKK